MEKEGITFVWVKAELINKNLKDDYDLIETYVDVPYSSEYFNSLKTEQKKAICQIRLLDKGIVTNYDSIFIGEKSDLDDDVDSFYEKIKGENDITPDSSVELKAEALLKQGDFMNVIALLEKENIHNTDIKLKAHVEYLMSIQEKYAQGQNEEKSFHSRTLEWVRNEIEKHANIILKMDRNDVFYAEELLKLYKVYPNERITRSMVARASEICKDRDAQFDGIKEQIKEISERYQKRNDDILNGKFCSEPCKENTVNIMAEDEISDAAIDGNKEDDFIFSTDDDWDFEQQDSSENLKVDK